MVAISIKSETRLDDDAWDALRGTPTFERMIRTCTLVTLDGPNDGIAKALREMEAWLEENNEKSLYYMTQLHGDEFRVYFENDAVQVAFALRFKDQEIEDPAPPPPVTSRPKGTTTRPTITDIQDSIWKYEHKSRDLRPYYDYNDYLQKPHLDDIDETTRKEIYRIAKEHWKL